MAHKIGDDWVQVIDYLKALDIKQTKELGGWLGLSQANLEHMKELPHDMVRAWLRGEDKVTDKCGPLLTWEILIENLMKMEQKGIAEKIREGQCKQTDTTDALQTDSVKSQPTQEQDYSNEVKESDILQEKKNNMRLKFAHLVRHILDMLMKRTIEIKGFRVFLGNGAVPGLCLKEIRTLTSVSDIFEFITDKKLWSFDNYTPLQNIAKEYLPMSDSPETKQLIDDYKKELESFKATTSLVDYINQCEDRKADPDKPLESNYDKKFYRKLSVKLKVRVTNETLEYVDEIWRELAIFFELPALSVLLDSVVSGSLVITWLIPHDFVSMIREGIKGPQVEKFFRKNGIIGVNIDEEVVYEYDAKLCLLKACKRGDVEEVMDLLQDLDDHNFSQHEDTPLGAASMHGHTDVVQILLLSGFEVDGRDKDGWTALMSASQQGRTDVVELLINHHADVNATRKNGWTALMSASHQGKTDVVELLIKHHADVNATTKDGVTALMSASQEGKTDVVELLINHHADVNATRKDGWTALMSSSQEGRTDVVELLIKHHADVNATNKAGWTALMLVSQEGTTDVVELLIKHHADVNATRKDGVTALMVASQNGRTDVVELLINHHADVNATSEDGWTALMSASQEGRTDVVELLINHHANVNATDEDGFTALMLASQEGWTDVVELLINHHADVNATTNDGVTALMLASDNGRTDVVEILIKHHADVNATYKFVKHRATTSMRAGPDIQVRDLPVGQTFSHSQMKPELFFRRVQKQQSESEEQFQFLNPRVPKMRESEPGVTDTEEKSREPSVH